MVKIWQRPQEQPKSKLTSGGKRHRPRRRSFWLSDTDMDMDAFLAIQARSVKWSTLARGPQLNRVHTVDVNAADIPGFVRNFAGKSLRFISVVKPQSFSSCRDQVQRLACALALDIHVAGCDMRANRYARTFLGSLWCPDFPPAPQVGIHTYSRLTCRELAQAWQRCMLKDEPLTRNRSFLGKESDQLAPLQSRGSAHQHRQKPWYSSS